MSFSIFSQNTKNDSLKVSKGALNLMKKDLQFCDSLKVAYAFKSKELIKLQQKNTNLFSKLQNENSRINLLENQIEKQKKDFQKIQKKDEYMGLWVFFSFIIGFFTGVYL